ncbi:hypothetical protein PQQ86_06845 [Paraburkholderia sediminicola]|jgi:hypothetical protein|uniref:hypothetical protein n=1 Tax=Paraburkholderia sediminicola TaxID=458836 RepID=UPI0038BC8D7A
MSAQQFHIGRRDPNRGAAFDFIYVSFKSLTFYADSLRPRSYLAAEAWLVARLLCLPAQTPT